MDKVICDANGKKIVVVSTDTVKESWIIKIKSNTCLEELTDFLALVRAPPRNMVAVPSLSHQLFGITPTEVWYAMKRYDSHVNMSHSHMWRQVGIACIQFLSDLHRIHRKVYMDMRLENILVSGSSFVVADYELVTSVSPVLTYKTGCDTRWYFYARGAERDAPLYSWRQDLVSLGYILVQLTGSNLPFFSDFMLRRFGRRANHKSTKLLLAERDRTVLAQANPTLVAYLTKIKEVEFSMDPPPASFYEDLVSLIKT